MKKIALILVLMTTLLSCSVGDADTYTSHALPIESYIIPENLVVGQSYTISVTYQKPTACYNYRGIYFGKVEEATTIVIVTDTKDGEQCSGGVPALSTVNFTFNPTEAKTYTFKFYKGQDENDDEIYEDVDVVVAD